jgi:cell division septation protein DedD
VEAAAPVAGDQPVSTTPPPARPKVTASKPKPDSIKVASAEDNNATDTTPTQSAGTGGGFAVQLAAPGSEQDARSISKRLGQKFGAVLDGHQPSVVKAEVGEKSIYRVRISSLSREEANSLCGKIKSKGGDCFVAKN